MNSSNPTLRESTFRGLSVGGERRMTIDGTVQKSFILLLLAAVTFTLTWNNAASGDGSAYGLAFAGGLAGMIISIVLSFRPRWSPVLAPIFALVEGAFLGAISIAFERGMATEGYSGYDGIVSQAMFGTIAVFATMLGVYKMGLIKVTQRFKAVVTTAMLSIFLVYLVSFVLSLFGTNIPMIHESGAIGIGFSALVIVIASLMLLVDFQMIVDGAREGAPKYMEWYGAFALLVTVVWIYIELLRLLAKLRSR